MLKQVSGYFPAYNQGVCGMYMYFGSFTVKLGHFFSVYLFVCVKASSNIYYCNNSFQSKEWIGSVKVNGEVTAISFDASGSKMFAHSGT